MTARTRIALAGAAALAALTLAGTALAAYTPKLVVTGASQATGGGGGVKVKFTVPQTDDPTARATFYVPAGYQVTTTGAAGQQLGTSTATVFAIDLNAVVPVAGTVEVGNPADFAAQATLCTGTPTHTATWVLRLSAAGTPLVVPVFVDMVVGPLAQIAVAQLVICLPPPDIPPGTPGRATLGAKLISAEFTANAIVNPAARGQFRWRALATPYTPAVGQVNAAGTVELQSIVNLPTQLTLRARVLKSAKKGVSNVTFNGLLLSNLIGVEGATVDVLKGATARGVRKLRSFTTTATGAFAGSFAQKQAKKATPVYLVARATTQDQDLGATGCTATFVPPISPVALPCINATIGGVTVSSPVVKVTVPAAPKTKTKK